jgi:hypothetical protein
MRDDVALDLQARSACISIEAGTTNAIADAGGASGTWTLTTGRRLWDRWWPLAGRKLGHRVAMASSDRRPR